MKSLKRHHRDRSRQIICPQDFIKNDKRINNLDDVGKNWKTPEQKCWTRSINQSDLVTSHDNLTEKKPSSLFLKPVLESQAVDVAH